MTALRVGVLAYPGCFASEVYGVPDLLTMATSIAGRREPAFDVAVMSPRRRVVAAGGIPVATSAVTEADVLIVPGFNLAQTPMADLAVEPELAVIRAHADAGRAVVAICVGALLLADAGLLAGRQATTAWLFADDLAQRCPDATITPERLVVTDTGVTTTAAFSAMYDFALDLIRQHGGDRVARTTARIALLDDARLAQTPYVDARLLPQPGNDFSQQAMRRLDQGITDPYRLPALAEQLGVSTRTLLRRFAAETGQSPLAYLQTARVRRARHLLETTDQTVAGVAAAVGYRDPGTFAALFTKHTGKGPSNYRAAFRRTKASPQHGPM